MEWNVYLRGHWMGRVIAQDERGAWLLAHQRYNRGARRGLRVICVG